MKGSHVGLLWVALSATALAEEAPAESCSLISRESNGSLKTTPMAALKVIEQTTKEGPFKLPRGAPKNVQAVICKRSSIMPAPHDYKVLQAGYTLYITDELSRIAALGMVDGRVRLDMIDGALTEVEQSQAGRLLHELETEMPKVP